MWILQRWGYLEMASFKSEFYASYPPFPQPHRGDMFIAPSGRHVHSPIGAKNHHKKMDGNWLSIP
jgi:hypothetical protein